MVSEGGGRAGTVAWVSRGMRRQRLAGLDWRFKGEMTTRNQALEGCGCSSGLGRHDAGRHGWSGVGALRSVCPE